MHAKLGNRLKIANLDFFVCIQIDDIFLGQKGNKNKRLQILVQRSLHCRLHSFYETGSIN